MALHSLDRRGAREDERFCRPPARSRSRPSGRSGCNDAGALGACPEARGVEGRCCLETAKQAFSLPWISGGNMRRFCSSVPKTATGCRPMMSPHMHGRSAREARARITGQWFDHHRGLGDAKATAYHIRAAGRCSSQPPSASASVQLVRKAADAVALAEPVGTVEAGATLPPWFRGFRVLRCRNYGRP